MNAIHFQITSTCVVFLLFLEVLDMGEKPINLLSLKSIVFVRTPSYAYITH